MLSPCREGRYKVLMQKTFRHTRIYRDKKNVSSSSQVYKVPSVWLRSQTSSVVFMVFFKVDSNFSIFVINIILIHKRVRQSENYSSNNTSKLVGNRNVYPDKDCFTFEPSTTQSIKSIRVKKCSDNGLRYLM